MGWFKEIIQSDYMKRQIDFMSSLGIFYILILALFGVPLMGAFVVVLIKGVIDFRYVIFGLGLIGTAFFIYFGIKFFIKFIRKVRKDGFNALASAGNSAARGEAVRIDVFGGLISFSYKSPAENGLLALSHDEKVMLTDKGIHKVPKDPPKDPIDRLKELSDLKKEGIIDDDEFKILKNNIMKSIDDSGDDPDENTEDMW